MPPTEFEFKVTMLVGEGKTVPTENDVRVCLEEIFEMHSSVESIEVEVTK